MTRKYELIIYWSLDDKAYIAEIPELPGCFGRGESYAEAVKRVQPAMDEWIATAKKDGREIPEPRTRPHFDA